LTQLPTMKADEYRMFIDDLVGYRMDVYFLRLLGEYKDRGSTRSNMAFLKSGMLQGIVGGMNRERTARLANEVGTPVPCVGSFNAPLDYLSNNYRGLNGIMKDMFRQPDNVLEACEAVLLDIVNRALASADPKKQLPIFLANHKPYFLSPKQFDTFYWPSFNNGVMMLI